MAWEPLPTGEGANPLIRRLKAIDVEIYGNIYAQSGTIGGDVTIEGDLTGNDILSSNWVSGGGTYPATSLPDASATGGYYLDASAGDAQLVGSVYVGGDFSLIGSGLFSTGGVAASRIEMSALSGTSPSTTIDHYGYYVSSTEHFLEDTTSWVSDLSRTWTFAPDYTGTYYFKVSRGTGPSMTASLYSENASTLGLVGSGGSTTFSVDDNGNYNAASHQFRTSATTRLTVSGTAVTSTVPIDAPAGTSGAAGLYLGGDSNTGFYSVSNNILGVTAYGSASARFTSDGISAGGNATGGFLARSAAGSESLPAYTFVGDTDTGIYRSAADVLSFSAGSNEISKISAAYVLLASNNATRISIGATPLATSGGTHIIYWNSTSGNLSRQTSSKRYKFDIDYDPKWEREYADFKLPPLARFGRYDSDEDARFVSPIAEDLYDVDPRLAVMDGEGEIDSYDHMAIFWTMYAKINQLEKQVKQLGGTT